MRYKNPVEIMDILRFISKKERLKISYLVGNLEEVNKRYNLRMTKVEIRKFLEYNNIRLSTTIKPFDIRNTMKYK